VSVDLVIGLTILVIAGAAYAAREARTRTLEETFRRLGAQPTRAKTRLFSVVSLPLARRHGAVEGCVRGIPLRYSFQTAGRSTPNRTLCEATLVQATELVMDLRPQTRAAERDVEHGRAIDLALGDAAFDDSFVVEAAPSELATALLDDRNIRTHLLAFSPCHVAIAGAKLTFRKDAYLAEPGEIGRVIEVCAEMASRLNVLPGMLQESRLARSADGDSGYRGRSPEAIRLAGQNPQGAIELEALHRVRSRRMRFQAVRAAAIVAIVVVVGWLLGLFRGSLPR
jgi:hypothetical protein